MVENYYPEQVFSRLTPSEIRQFWDQKDQKPNNWLGLCAHLLRKEFSREFLVPLQQSDHSFLLRVNIKFSD
jgi:hypothetical protein